MPAWDTNVSLRAFFVVAILRSRLKFLSQISDRRKTMLGGTNPRKKRVPEKKIKKSCGKVSKNTSGRVVT
jgi:hypothetical protein